MTIKTKTVTVTFTQTEAEIVEALLLEIEEDARNDTNFAASAPHIDSKMRDTYEGARLRFTQAMKEAA